MKIWLYINSCSGGRHLSGRMQVLTGRSLGVSSPASRSEQDLHKLLVRWAAESYSQLLIPYFMVLLEILLKR